MKLNKIRHSDEIIQASSDDELCLCEMYKRVLTNGTKRK